MIRTLVQDRIAIRLILRRILLVPVTIVLAIMMQTKLATVGAAESDKSGQAAITQQNYLTNICAALTRQWPANRTINIACHGHSVPAGYFKTPLVKTFDSYPHLVHVGLKERFPNAVINVVVTAIGGEDSKSGEARFERDVLAFHPDVVTIDYGLNDRRIGLKTAETAWRGMITNAVAHGAKVILFTPTPDLAARWDDSTDPLNQHAEQIRHLAKEYGVGLVDSLEAFRAKVKSGIPLEKLMAQSNHPNREGHELVATEMLKWFPGK